MFSSRCLRPLSRPVNVKERFQRQFLFMNVSEHKFLSWYNDPETFQRSAIFRFARSNLIKTKSLTSVIEL